MAAEIRTEARVIDIQVSNARIEAAMARACSCARA